MCIAVWRIVPEHFHTPILYWKSFSLRLLQTLIIATKFRHLTLSGPFRYGRLFQEPNRNRKAEPLEPFFQEPKVELELSAPSFRNRNRKRPSLLNCTETQQGLPPLTKEPPEPKTGIARTVMGNFPGMLLVRETAPSPLRQTREKKKTAYQGRKTAHYGGKTANEGHDVLFGLLVFCLMACFLPRPPRWKTPPSKRKRPRKKSLKMGSRGLRGVPLRELPLQQVR